MSVLKVIDSCCPLLAVNAGGIDEIVPEFYRPIVLTANSRKEITDGILRYLEMDNEQRVEIVNGLKRSAAEKQEEINNAFREKNRELRSRKVDGFAGLPAGGRLVSVIVPLFNCHLRYLEDLSVSLNNQTTRPKEVIFVDDGSEKGYGEDAQRTIASVLKIPYRMIKQDNSGASGAKNTAWRNAATKYIIAIDSDNMLKPDFVYKTVAFMERSPDCAVVTTYFDLFNDGDNYENQKNTVNRYRPKYGSIIMGQLQNIFGDNIGCYRRDVLEKVGGWDEYGRVKAGDWAFYLNLTCRGHKTGIINESLALYRVRKDSAIVKMNKYISDRCIARNNVCLPRFEAYSLHRMIRDYDSLQRDTQYLKQTCDRMIRDYDSLQRDTQYLKQTCDMMRHEHARLSYRITRKFLSMLERIPIISTLLTRILLRVRGLYNRTAR
jgi:glycosyltransferase involved in cell wall biosynthesis